jgi:putative toxin-antitoxin system antitoxin component (TIGR02293 family)
MANGQGDEKMAHIHKSAGKVLKSGSTLGFDKHSPMRLADIVKRGLPIGALYSFEESCQLPMATIQGVIRLPNRTLDRRKQEGMLKRDEAERLLRLALVYEKAVNLFEGDAAAARTWLAAPAKALGNETPLSLVETEIGAREVEDLIGRLEHGVFS